MNKRLLSVLVFALAVSGVATFLVAKVIQGRFSASTPAPSTTLLVAAHDLGIGTMIKEGDLKTTQWTGTVPAQAINKLDDLKDRGVISPIYAGEPIIDTRLAPKGGGAGLAAMIPKGMRAVAVRVNDVVGVAGFVLPGMRVDILVSGNPPNEPSTLGTETKTILQNIEVLSAGQSIQKDSENKPISVQVVNLLVSPEQAEALSLASNDARIQLVLRNPLDTAEANTPGTAMAYLFGKSYFAPIPGPAPRRAKSGGAHQTPRVVPVAAQEPPVQVKPAVVTIEVLHGAKRQEEKFTKTAEVRQ